MAGQILPTGNAHYHISMASLDQPESVFPFMKLPPELRLKVYVFAVFCENPIIPSQVFYRSNKFTWDRTRVPRYRYYDSHSDAVPHLPYLPPLTTTQLALTSRQVYNESWKVFYLVNNFKFEEPRQLCQYLTAITPERRRAIRCITIDPKGWYHIWFGKFFRPYSHPSSFGSSSFAFPVGKRQRGEMQSAVTLLCQCKDLRDLVVIETLNVRGVSYNLTNRECLERRLKYLLACLSQKARGSQVFLWNLPSLQLSLEFEGVRINVGAAPAEDIACLIPSSVSSTSRLRQGQVPGLIGLVDDAVKSLKELAIQKTNNAFNLTSLQLSEAIESAALDFPGEVRINRDPSNSSGFVSSRTRQQSKAAANVTGLGTVVPEKEPRYDAEGLLLDCSAVVKVRRSGSHIECEVVSSEGKSWEALTALTSVNGMDYLQGHYRLNLQRLERGSAVDHLQELMDLPAPREIATDMNQDFPRDEIKTIPRGLKTLWKKWTPLQNRYEKLVENLEKQVQAGTKVQTRKPKKFAAPAKRGKAGKSASA